jgi:hypothetical protein
MAPVVAVGAFNAKAVGIAPGAHIAPSGSLSFRDPLDPPAGMLERGLPKACGARIAVGSLDQAAALQQILAGLESK